MRTYELPLNIIVFLGAFWTAVIQGVATSSWLVVVLWLTFGFAALTSERLTPARLPGPDAAV